MLPGSESPPQAAGLQSRQPGNAQRQHHLAQTGYLASVYPSVGPSAHPSHQQTSTTHTRAEQSPCSGERLLRGLTFAGNLSARLCPEGTLGTWGPSLRPCSAPTPVHGQAELSPACSGLSDAQRSVAGGPLPAPPGPPASSVSSARALPGRHSGAAVGLGRRLASQSAQASRHESPSPGFLGLPRAAVLT